MNGDHNQYERDQENVSYMYTMQRQRYAAPYTKNDTTAEVLHKEWVGLTGKEIAECIETGEGGFVKLLATYRAIEARLKEKNT